MFSTCAQVWTHHNIHIKMFSSPQKRNPVPLAINGLFPHSFVPKQPLIYILSLDVLVLDIPYK